MLNLFVFNLLVSGNRKIVIVLLDCLKWNEYALCRFFSSSFEFLDDVWNVSFPVNKISLLVQRITIRFHVVEPDLLGPAALNEHKYSGAHPGIRLEDSGRHRYHSLKVAILKQ